MAAINAGKNSAPQKRSVTLLRAVNSTGRMYAMPGFGADDVGAHSGRYSFQRQRRNDGCMVGQLRPQRAVQHLRRFDLEATHINPVQSQPRQRGRKGARRLDLLWTAPAQGAQVRTEATRR